jgi:hypothetical protein
MTRASALAEVRSGRVEAQGEDEGKNKELEHYCEFLAKKCLSCKVTFYASS